MKNRGGFLMECATECGSTQAVFDLTEAIPSWFLSIHQWGS